MPAVMLMTWSKSQKRWFKSVYNEQGTKTTKAVSPKVLAQKYPHLFKAPTEEGSYRAANQWWQDYEVSQQDTLQGKLKVVKEWAERNIALVDASRKIMDKAPPLPSSTMIQEMSEQELRAKLLPTTTATLADLLEKWLVRRSAEVGAGQLKPGTVENGRCSVQYFVNWWGDREISAIDDMAMDDYRIHLLEQIKKREAKPATCRDRIMALRQFVRWQARTVKAFPLPATLFDRDYSIKVAVNKKSPWTDEQVKFLLDNSKGQWKLLFLLMLNTGQLQAELAAITHKDVDWRKGTVTIRRQKEGDHANVPTVEYVLWDETFRLLREHRSDHPELVLVTKFGTPLAVREEKSTGKGKLHRNDTVGKTFWRWNTQKKWNLPELKHLRKSGSSKLDAHGEYARYSCHYLGQSGRSVAQRYYITPNKEQFAKAIKWLGEQFGFETTR